MPSEATIYLSPLRYPGGKGRLAPFVSQLVRAQARRPLRYVEPFAGGAGVGLRLLFDEQVDEVVLNDLNPGIAAFWRVVFDAAPDLIAMVRSCPPTVEEWHRQRLIYSEGTDDDLALGFATFFLNRTNRSGILVARPIGGFDQSGSWKIDARWNPDKLAARIELLAGYSTRVDVQERDGIELIQEAVKDDGTFVYADPPYVVQGDELYMDTLTWSDHESLAATLTDAQGWFLTYDADERVLDLYADMRCASFGIAHTAATQHIGREIAVFSRDMTVPSLALLGRDAEDASYL